MDTNQNHQRIAPVFHLIWQISLLSFIIAAITGFLYRYGMLYPLPGNFNFANIRHAHSHLMFFNWVSPPIMAYMANQYLQKHDSESTRPFLNCLIVMLFLGFLSFPFFLFYGYQSVAIGSLNLPLAAIISGLVMITWYWFAWLIFSLKKSGFHGVSRSMFDGALLTLLISSLGAWGVSIFQFTSIDSPLISSAMTHFFLSVFTEGWAVLGVLAIMWTKAGIPKTSINPGWLWVPILFGSMLIFPFSLTQTLITPAMLITAYAGILLIVISLSINLYLLIKQGTLRGFIWNSILVFIGLKILFQIAAILPIDIWPGEHGLRVLYLHILLLGIVSIVLIERFHAKSSSLKYFFTISVFMIILSLMMISGYWPLNLLPPNIYLWVMIFAILPIIPAVLLWFDSFR